MRGAGALMEYERVQMDEEGREDIRYRQAMLKRWRFSMFMSFAAGVLITMAVYHTAVPCPEAEVIAEDVQGFPDEGM